MAAVQPRPLDSDGHTRLIVLDEPQRVAAVQLIQSLPTRARGPKKNYRRAAYGQAWSDEAAGVLWAGNGCRTRDDILLRDLDEATTRDGCVAVSGDYTDPYTGRAIRFTKANAAESPVDHVFSLSLSWQLGAADWTSQQRLQFANDPLNLVLTTREPNDDKSDASPASWLPPNEEIRCAYVYRFARVAGKYRLPVPAEDREVMLAQCR